MTHMSSYRHLGNKRMFAPVFKDNEKQQQQHRQQSRDREPDSNEWPPPKSRHSRPEPFGIKGLPQPHKRYRPGTTESLFMMPLCTVSENCNTKVGLSGFNPPKTIFSSENFYYFETSNFFCKTEKFSVLIFWCS